MSHLFKYLFRLALLIAQGAVLSHVALAATPNVDAGSLLHQTEQELSTTKSQALPAAVTKPKTSTNISDSETSLQVQGFQFIGNSLISSNELNAALAIYSQRTLNFSQLKEATEAVMTRYRESGWTARAILPKQEIENGIVKIQIIEAIFGKAIIQGESPQRIEVNRILEAVESHLPYGKAVHADQVDRILLLLDDLPGVNVSGNFVEGQVDGETNLAITATDEAYLTGNGTIDNQGSRSTGVARLSVNLNINSPARMGDLFNINTLKTQGSQFERIGYSIPLGDDGWRMGLHSSSLSYRIITDDFSSLNANGTAKNKGLDISYPFIRSQLKNINLNFNHDIKDFDNSSNGSSTAYQIKSNTLALSSNLIDSWGGGGSNTFTLSTTTGQVGSDALYRKYDLSLSRLQNITPDLSFFASGSAQTANSNLDSSEKFYLGGINGVRAYPSSEAGGSQGNLFTLELRNRVTPSITLTGFYDQGQVSVNQNNSISSPANPNSYSLKGFGFSLAWQVSQGIDVKASLAQRVGQNPAAQANGTDSDGTKKLTRFWLSMGIAF